MYRRNRRRAVRKIIGENTKMCYEDPDKLEQQFFNANISDCDLSIYDDWDAAAVALNFQNVLTIEVSSRLSSAENAKPDLDRLTYDHSIYPDALALSTIFSLFIKYKKSRKVGKHRKNTHPNERRWILFQIGGPSLYPQPSPNYSPDV